MQYFKNITILFFITVISFYSCRIEPKPAPDAKVTNPAMPEPAQNVAGVYHYTCSRGHSGGSETAGTCKTCGIPLAHNAAYHATGTPTTTPTPAPYSTAPFATPPATTPATAPAQNIAGVWHYTCGNGCAGGSGTVGNCSTCGNSLAHNQAYHE